MANTPRNFTQVVKSILHYIPAESVAFRNELTMLLNSVGYAAPERMDIGGDMWAQLHAVLFKYIQVENGLSDWETDALETFAGKKELLLM